jgi:hypothetical protein
MTWHLWQHLFGFWPGSSNSPQYLFWSGAGSDLGYLAIAASIVGHAASSYRARTCEVHRCWRIGRHMTAAGHKVCRRHHPDDKLTHDDILAANWQAIRNEATKLAAATAQNEAAKQAPAAPSRRKAGR